MGAIAVSEAGEGIRSGEGTTVPARMEAARIPSSTLPPWPSGRPLRAWQERALEGLLASPADDFLASATPAAGKTTFGLRAAYELLRRGIVSRVAVVAPTTHICRQGGADAARYGIDLDPGRANSDGTEPSDRHGVAVTYATVASGPQVHAAAAACARRRTLLIADEPHHMGELATWGQSAARAFARSSARLLLSGTPFRSDNSAIPWVRYDADGISCADHVYTYTDSAARPPVVTSMIQAPRTALAASPPRASAGWCRC